MISQGLAARLLAATRDVLGRLGRQGFPVLRDLEPAELVRLLEAALGPGGQASARALRPRGAGWRCSPAPAGDEAGDGHGSSD